MLAGTKWYFSIWRFNCIFNNSSYRFFLPVDWQAPGAEEVVSL
jgi:hypothetical protein